MQYRIEKDSLGQLRVPADKYWGAQTQRSLQNFEIGTEKMPDELIDALTVIKKGAALANLRLGVLDSDKCSAICRACDDILSGALSDNFPLSVWQTGSGTQTNMNVNEVIARRCADYGVGDVHPNDHVNKSQSSNDTFPSAMRIAAVAVIEDRLLPAAAQLIEQLRQLEAENADLIKVGRTHLQDAVPIKFSQEVGGWRGMLEKSSEMLRQALPALYELPLGGTAVGTGLNAPSDFDAAAAAQIAGLTGRDFSAAENKFHALTSLDAFVFAHGAVKAMAADLCKIANDVRWLASGPRSGLGELLIPSNEPGSSIMPGKVNPTQCEAVTMVAAQVIGNDAAIGFAASQGNFQLNVFLPVCIYNFLQSARLLADSMVSFSKNCVSGIKPNRAKMKENLDRSLMLVTALNPVIGYDNASKVAKAAYDLDISLADAAEKLGFLSHEQALAALDPSKMV